MEKDPKEKIDKSHLTQRDWHSRYLQQAIWTRELRRGIFCDPLLNHDQILEIGCGTGAVLNDHQRNKLSIGVDIQYPPLKFAKNLIPGSSFLQADGLHLPFKDSLFDITFCHFLLLWVLSPAQVLLEMRRVTKPGGMVAAFAEPDHEVRLDHPNELIELGKAQTISLKKQGADTSSGRKLLKWFADCGLDAIKAGILGWSKPAKFIKSDWEMEWKVIESDLRSEKLSRIKLEEIKNRDRQAWERGDRILFVPTFYAYGFVSK